MPPSVTTRRFYVLIGCRLLASLKDLAGNRSGTIALTTGLMATSLLGIAGLSVDVGSWYFTRRAMQSAADAAAIAGVQELARGSAGSQVMAAASNDADLNGNGPNSGATVNSVISNNNQSVTVTLSKPATQFLSRLFLSSAPVIQVSAQASLVNNGGPVCLLATATNGAGVSVTGNGTITANGCSLVSNSTSPTSITISGNGTIDSSTTCTPGGYSASGNAVFNPMPSHCPAIADPLANLTPPPQTNDPCQYNNLQVNGAQSLSPGVYCNGITLSGNANVTFQPGVYILRNGGISASGNAALTGTGVGFYMTGTGTAVQLSKDDINTSGNVTIQMSAPTSGPLAGLIFYQDHSAPTGDVTNTFSGNSNMQFEGTLYFGNQNVVVTGNGTADGNAPFTSIIANTLTYSGNGNLVFNSNYQNSNVPPPPGMQLSHVVLTQ